MTYFCLLTIQEGPCCITCAFGPNNICCKLFSVSIPAFKCYGPQVQCSFSTQISWNVISRAGSTAIGRCLIPNGASSPALIMKEFGHPAFGSDVAEPSGGEPYLDSTPRASRNIAAKGWLLLIINNDLSAAAR